ncbi:MAG: hypothetical protein JO256_01785, partial [Alphaproteobacteria bacterium]|nr:hypothetical protein [Alphaproteobacteria bacterium]
EYLFCDRGFVPTITTVVPADIARRVRYYQLRPAEDAVFAIRLFLAGCKFVMAEEPGAVWHDIADSARSSAVRDPEAFGHWLEEIRPFIPSRAYHGARGWAYAKLVRHRRSGSAFLLFCEALARGCYRPKLAIVVFLQLLLTEPGYRRLADSAIRWFGAGLRERPPRGIKAVLASPNKPPKERNSG